MLEMWIGEKLSIALVNADLVALWAALPLLVFGYAQKWRAVRRIRPEFSLRQSEKIELDRAVQLYVKVSRRLDEIRALSKNHGRFWRVVVGSRSDSHQHDADELEDLEAHAQILRATISRLKGLPLQRIELWVHIKSSRFASGGAVATHVVVLASLIVALLFFEKPAWFAELTRDLANAPIWYYSDIFYANAIAAGFAAVITPVLYHMWKAGLRRAHEIEFYTHKDFANSDFCQRNDQAQTDEFEQELAQLWDATELDGGDSWLAVLGLPQAATIEDAKEAYKTLVKQNHPDRVHDMSPAFRKLAEAETKKLNAAYQQALTSLSSCEIHV